jgi:hypothetical protein
VLPVAAENRLGDRDGHLPVDALDQEVAIVEVEHDVEAGVLEVVRTTDAVETVDASGVLEGDVLHPTDAVEEHHGASGAVAVEGGEAAVVAVTGRVGTLQDLQLSHRHARQVGLLGQCRKSAPEGAVIEGGGRNLAGVRMGRHGRVRGRRQHHHEASAEGGERGDGSRAGEHGTKHGIASRSVYFSYHTNRLESQEARTHSSDLAIHYII